MLDQRFPTCNDNSATSGKYSWERYSHLFVLKLVYLGGRELFDDEASMMLCD